MSAYDVLVGITKLLPENQIQAHAALKQVNKDFGYTAPECTSKRWDKLWHWIVTEIVPHDAEEWTTPIKEYWQQKVPLNPETVREVPS